MSDSEREYRTKEMSETVLNFETCDSPLSFVVAGLIKDKWKVSIILYGFRNIRGRIGV